LQAQQRLPTKTTTVTCIVCLDVQDLRDEYVRHFQNQDFVVGRKYEAQLSKTLLPRISAADLQKLADRFKPSSSCTVKAISHNRYNPRKYLTTDEKVAADLQKLADGFESSSSCTVKAISHNRYMPKIT